MLENVGPISSRDQQVTVRNQVGVAMTSSQRPLAACTYCDGLENLGANVVHLPHIAIAASMQCTDALDHVSVHGWRNDSRASKCRR